MEGSDRTAAGRKPFDRAPLPLRIRALLYDFDDTIVESERHNDELFSRVLREDFHVELSEAELDYLYGFSWAGVFEWLREHRGLVPTRAQVWERFLARKRAFYEATTLRVASGIERMLALPAAHVVVSGSSREEVLLMLDNAGLDLSSFRFLVCDDDCARGKPAPDGYLLALERLGVPAAEALVFEDSRAGIAAAKAAGVVVAFMGELASRDSSADADLRFSTFEQAWEAVCTRVAGPGT